ncbi:MAG: TRZ/ATZ family hydrolase [Gammaproteobacteria bacterium]
MKIDTLIHAGWIVPVEPENVVLEQYAIAIHEGEIVELLPSIDAIEKYQAGNVHHLEDHLLTPGLINAHTHAAMNLFRGLSDDKPLMTWLNDHIWPAEQEAVSAEFVLDGTRHAIAEMIHSGTTCFNDMYFFPDQVAHIATVAGMRTMVGMIVIDFPSAWANDAEAYFHKGLEVHDQYRNEPLVSTCFAPHAPYTVNDEALKKVAVHAEELDVQITIHLHEIAHEVEESIKQTGERPIQRLERLGLLSPRLIAVHMTQLNDVDKELIKKHGVNIVHCPESNLKLASGFCPVFDLEQNEVNVALGTDGAASNNDLDMLGEMRSAALLAKGVSQNAEALPAFKALKMATLNGAKALGLDDKIGSLTVGKQADIIAVNMNTIETQPLYDPISQLIYSANRDQISDVWVAGRQLLQDGKLQTLDEQEILQKSREWQAELKKHH